MNETKTEMITQTTVLEMGFSKSMIAKLLPPPTEKPNPYYRNSAPMKLWSKADVLQVMETDEYKNMLEKVNKRKQSAKRAAETKKDNLVKTISDYADHISIKVLKDEVLIQRTISAKKDWNYCTGHFYDDWEFQSINDETLSRWVVNYIRHNLVEYDRTLYGLRGKTGKSEAYVTFKRAILSKIALAYPKYSDECVRQSEKLNYYCY